MKRRGLIRFIMLMAFLSSCFFESVSAQEDQYIDAPVVPAGQEQTIPAGAGAARSTFVDQLNSGMISCGFSDPIYYQYTGNSIFNQNNFPPSLFSDLPFLNLSFISNVGWNHFMPLDFEFNSFRIPAYSFGAELLYFRATSEDVYDSKSDVVGPLINLDLYMMSGFVRLFFMDPSKDFLQPFFGVGWGIINGYFEATKTDGSKHKTTFAGPMSNISGGVQIAISGRAGLMAELKSLRGEAATSNDPFDQTSGSSFELDFSGIMIGLTGYFRF